MRNRYMAIDTGAQNFRQHINRMFPRRSAQRGLLVGSTLTVLVAAITLSTVHFTAAQTFSNPDQQPASSQASASNFNGSGNATPAAAPAAALAAPAAKPASSAPAPKADNGRYVALGDSVAAGLGLAALPNPAGFDTVCGRSSQAYGYEVGRQLGLPTELIACSGATAGDLNTAQGIDNSPNPSSQISTAFAGGTPRLISITAGANDLRWNELLKACVATTCGSKSHSALVDGAIVLMKGKYRVALENIKLRSSVANSATPKVIMTGYYHPVSAACANMPALKGRLTHAELVWINGMVDKINHNLNALATSAAYKDFARFAPVNFTGHDLCSGDSWIQGLENPKTAVHPTAAGQQAIAKSVVQAAKR